MLLKIHFTGKEKIYNADEIYQETKYEIRLQECRKIAKKAE